MLRHESRVWLAAGAEGLALADGALADGALADGALADGALADGALADGALVDGALVDGALVDGALVDGALVDGALVDGALVPGGELAPGSELAALESQLDRLDVELLTLVRRRTALARRLGTARADAGGTRFVHERELAVVYRFRQLGAPGRDLATILLRLGR